MARQIDIVLVLEALYQRAKREGLRPRQVAGVSLGGCCDAIGTARKGAFRRKAHAHTSARDPHRDWICVLADKEERLVAPSGKPTALLVHEYAHILTHAGHTAAWRAAVTALGASNEAKQYLEREANRHHHDWTAWALRDSQEFRHCPTCGWSEMRSKVTA